jgi:cobalt-zinc-cadmium efflux system membrane fusion protein
MRIRLTDFLKLKWQTSKNYLMLLALMISVSQAFAHGGKIEVSEAPHGPVHLSAEQAKAVDLRLVEAGSHPLADLLSLNGEIRLLPDSQSDVNVRISGQVMALYANLDDTVKVGQPLAKVQSRLVGDPPPTVVVNAPIQGVIDARNVTLGQAVEPNTALFHISDRSQVMVSAHVYEEDVGKVKLGQEAYVHVISYPNQAFVGKITLIEPNLDPLTRTVNIWITLANPEGILKPGMFARADVVLKKNATALAVPNAAILEANGEKFVFGQDGDHYQRIVIKTGANDDEYTEITDGLVPGDKVVTQGNRELYTVWLTGGQSKAAED